MIGPGDWVVRVRVPVVPYESRLSGINDGRPDKGRFVGRVAQVEAVVGPICGHMGLILVGWHNENHPSRAWPAIAFRKIEPPEESEIARRIRACRPKTRELEPCDSDSRSESRDANAARSEGRQSGGEAASPNPNDLPAGADLLSFRPAGSCAGTSDDAGARTFVQSSSHDDRSNP